MLRRSWVLRKCAVIVVVFVIASITLHFRAERKSEESPEQYTIHRHSNRKLHQAIESRDRSSNSTSKPSTLSKEHVKEAQNEKSKGNKTKETPYKKIINKQQPKQIPIASTLIPLFKKNITTCTSPAYKEFPSDVFSQKSRSKGAIIFHVLIVLYMFYCLAIVCDHYFLPSLEECCQRLNLSEDVAGATFMAAGSSAPELFTAILGVFIAKGDVGTGTIVGSAVFNILFVIGLCALYTTSTQLNWWPVARDTSYYIFTVLVLILFIYDGIVSTFESFVLLALYVVYIVIMNYNAELKEYVTQQWLMYGKPQMDELDNLKTNSVQYQSFQIGENMRNRREPNPKVTIFEAANIVIIKHKRLFSPILRFRSAAYLIILQRRKSKAKAIETAQQLKLEFPPQVNQLQRFKSVDSTAKMSILPDDEFWRKVPDYNSEGWYVFAKWAIIAPVHAALFYTIPNCKARQDLFLVTFGMSILWTAIFSYIMVWMVTLIGFTLGIPDSIMGITFLAAGTSVPDAYASLHVAKQGQGDMAVSNSIGSNVFDILIGLALPWFVETAIVYPGTVASINSKGMVYAVILLFISLLMTIYLFHKYKWTLNPQLGIALLTTYGVFLLFSCALEFNLFGVVNPPTCPD